MPEPPAVVLCVHPDEYEVVSILGGLRLIVIDESWEDEQMSYRYEYSGQLVGERLLEAPARDLDPERDVLIRFDADLNPWIDYHPPQARACIIFADEARL